jgi:ABC-2 type transport system ATP-binding protein
LFGQKGAGITTLLEILAGYLQPDDGRVVVDDLDVLNQPRAAQLRIGYLPANGLRFPGLTVQTYLNMMAEIRHSPRNNKAAEVLLAIHTAGLEGYLTQLLGQLSLGIYQRVGLAQAILHNPDLLILDKPTLGLALEQVNDIRRLIKRLTNNRTLLLSTHTYPEISALCDRAIIFEDGEITADYLLDRKTESTDSLLILDEEISGVEEAIRKLGGVTRIEHFHTFSGHPAYQIHGEFSDLTNQWIFQLVADRNWPLLELREVPHNNHKEA